MELLDYQYRFLWPIWVEGLSFTFNPGDGTGSFVHTVPNGWYYNCAGIRVDEPEHLMQVMTNTLNATLVARGSAKLYRFEWYTPSLNGTSTIQRASMRILRIAGSSATSTTISSPSATFKDVFGWASITNANLFATNSTIAANVIAGIWSSPVKPHDNRTRRTRQAFASSQGPAHYANAWPTRILRDWEFRNLHPANVRSDPPAISRTVPNASVVTRWGDKQHLTSSSPGSRQSNLFERFWNEANMSPYPVLVMRADSSGSYPVLADPNSWGYELVRMLPDSLLSFNTQTEDVGWGERYDVRFSTELLAQELAP